MTFLFLYIYFDKRSYKVYIENKDTKTFNFSCNLTEFLSSRGVSLEVIKESKNKILETNYRELYSEITHDHDIRLVPTKQLVGTSRSEPWTSLYDNINIIKNKPGALKHKTIEFNLNKLDELGIEKLRLSYAQLIEPVCITYYKDEDVYFVNRDGNHRSLVAMLIGAEYIRAHLDICRCNFEKKSYYNKIIRKFKDNYKITKICAATGNEYNLLDCVNKKSKISNISLNFNCEETLRNDKKYMIDGSSGDINEVIRQLSEQIENY